MFSFCICAINAQSSAVDLNKYKKETPKKESSTKKSATKKEKKSSGYSTPKSKSGSSQKSYFYASDSELYFNSSGDSEKTITVTASSSWNVSVNTANWGHLSRYGNLLYVSVDANTSTSPRTDYFVLQSGSKTVRIDIYQEGAKEESASISNVWVDHNVYENGVKGMKIHVKFDVNGMLNKKGQIAAYFYNSNGNPLKDSNNSYCSVDGNVSAGSSFTPNYENCRFNDFTIFMPYSELHLTYPSGNSISCYFMVTIWNGWGNGVKGLATSTKYYFTMKQ